ncbi:SMP-30/gluconolactonase/LRE family protein [Amnibacterium flavum]|uniref:SMP-30/gluconolactonase/LRE family protein n=1 Tax=Amnibacterium flavum TaxID=2173173 RepID=UPI001F0BE035|nr:SMP-30/gluconolactonase/LRE family protein [Amnibacterium flavum]
MNTTAEQVTSPIAKHGEGPLWDPKGNRLLFVDLLVGDIISVSPDGDTARHHIDDIAAALRIRDSGGFVVAVEQGFRFLDDDLRRVGDYIPAFDTAGVRMNDGGCDPQGRFYCGSMAYSAADGAGTLYSIEADHSVRTVLSGVTISNGLQWNAAGTRAFYNDTPTARVDVYDFDGESGAFSNRRTFTEVPGPGMPDGMAIDEQDGIWIALWEGSSVQHYDRDGRLDRVVELPVSRVTACTFGGDDLKTLYITTSQEEVDLADEPLAGAVFSVRVDVAGARAHTFAG